jgi:hypothetical protein
MLYSVVGGCWFVFGRCRIQISAGSSAIQKEVFCGFCQSISANTGLGPQIEPPLFVSNLLFKGKCKSRQSYWPRGLRRRSAAARLLRSWVRIPPGTWIFVCCECRVLSGRGLCDELITRSEEFYRLWCVVVCDLETSRIRGGSQRHKKRRLKSSIILPFEAERAV